MMVCLGSWINLIFLDISIMDSTWQLESVFNWFLIDLIESFALFQVKRLKLLVRYCLQPAKGLLSQVKPATHYPWTRTSSLFIYFIFRLFDRDNAHNYIIIKYNWSML